MERSKREAIIKEIKEKMKLQKPKVTLGICLASSKQAEYRNDPAQYYAQGKAKHLKEKIFLNLS